jgi:hypothetical protein
MKQIARLIPEFSFYKNRKKITGAFRSELKSEKSIREIKVGDIFSYYLPAIL